MATAAWNYPAKQLRKHKHEELQIKSFKRLEMTEISPIDSMSLEDVVKSLSLHFQTP